MSNDTNHSPLLMERGKGVRLFFLRHLLTILCVIAISVLSLFPVKELHLEGMTLSDKWAHSIMYGGMTIAMLLDANLPMLRRPFQLSTFRFQLSPSVLIFPILLGGIMELLQAYCTGGNRSGDWLDALANAIGSATVFFLALLIKAVAHKRQ